ncbi:Phosphatidylethanolamine-binding F40A3.3 [Amphibalanus amphitrite]|uniref:Phosphatidylethanolamine-binding F40A3.3 n=1 Tax=Amphibalanus amphitrite TaxID=1232801 RepID=A0A6A4UW08_AMPAM|nr:Phosphatidylethanolamine-binding F40A3.3 [Amphibalanus amphitrite]
MLLPYFILIAGSLLSPPTSACELAAEQSEQSVESPVRLTRSVTAMETHKVVPDVIPVGPAAVLTVTYPGGVTVDGGAELTPTQVKEQPQLSWAAESGALYTVVMTDPDAPSRADPKFGEWRHWLLVNVPGTDLAAGDAVSEFVGSGPPKGTGLHRYVFLVYKQPGKITVDEALRKTKNQAKGREKWSVSKFAEQHNLGAPVAGNLYQAQWDDYVPQLYKQFND